MTLLPGQERFWNVIRHGTLGLAAVCAALAFARNATAQEEAPAPEEEP